MQTAVVSIKIDPELKKKAQKVAEDSGYSLNVLFFEQKTTAKNWPWMNAF